MQGTAGQAEFWTEAVAGLSGPQPAAASSRLSHHQRAGSLQRLKIMGGLDPLSNIDHCFPKLEALMMTVKMTRHSHDHHNTFKISQKSISQRIITSIEFVFPGTLGVQSICTVFSI